MAKLLDPIYLEQMRSFTDPVADQAVLTLVDKAADKEKAVLDLFDKLTKDDAPVPGPIPMDLKDYFEQTAVLPEWADMARIKRGEEVFGQFGPEFIINLFCKSLPEAYACKNGAQVLYHTGRLNIARKAGGDLDQTYNVYNRRIMETAQFIINVMAPGGLGPGGDGIRTAQKIRLIHASIRHFLKASGQWDMAWGEPINQEDLAGTLMTFSIELIDGAGMLGARLSAEQAEDYLHAWRVVGHLIGIRTELLPDSVTTARKLRNLILERQAAPSPQGQALTKALIGFMNYLTPSRIFYPVPEYLISRLIGKRLSYFLDVKSHSFIGLITLNICRLTFGLFTLIEVGIIRKWARALSMKFIQAMITEHSDGKPVKFWVPPSLKGDWKIEEAS